MMTHALGPGDEMAGYRIQSVLGQGGMGTVYLAERPQGGVCALKVLSRKHGDDASYAARFKREARYVEALDHPHTLELYEAGEAPDGTLYLAMQYVSGPDLGVLVARDGVLDLAQALSILGQIGDALDCAHAQGLIHRDVKPGNVIVARDPAPNAFLTDFGLSKNPDQDSVALTKQGQFVGTTAYAAPEEILGQPRDHRVDIYSLGCVLFEVLVGEPPFVRDGQLDVMYAHIGDPRPAVGDRRSGLPPELDAVIAKAMAIAPEDRYASCAELINAAAALLPTSVSRKSMRLVVRAGPAAGRELLVTDGLLLGRLTTLDGALADDHEISRRQARVHLGADGGFVVEDTASANGTFVNGIRIDGPQTLRDGDELQFGSTVFDIAISDQHSAVAEPVVEPSPSEASKKVAVRLELDLEAGELSLAIEPGPSLRIARGADGWRVEPS